MKYTRKLSESFVAKYEDLTPPWGPVGFIVYRRTYARQKDDGGLENWQDTISRIINGIIDVGGAFTQDEVETLFHYMFNLKCSPGGRHLWQLGTPVIQRVGADSLQNCWHVAIDDPIEPFCFAFNELMLGGGVGFNITPQYVYSLPEVRHDVDVIRVDDNDVNFIVPDNREGWVELLRRILTSFFFTGQSLTYSTNAIRARGKPIKTFGGTASGSEDLVTGIGNIVRILKSRVGQKLRPIDCLDIVNIVGSIVVAGNVRRSAEITLGDPLDPFFIDAKNWNKNKVPDWRTMSNNSVVCDDIASLPESFWSNYNGEGEPCGLFNLRNARRFGRISDGENYRPDHRVVGMNPCGEITLESYESCNLQELFLPNLGNINEFAMAAELMFKVGKVVSCIPFSHPKTQEVVDRNHRIGVGATGVLQALHYLETPGTFDAVYRHLEDVDRKYSKVMKCNESIKLTTVKPSGTLSLLAGVTPGVHPAFSDYYIRRIRFAADDPLVALCRENGYHVEPKMTLEGGRDMKTMVIEFPVKTPEGTVLADEISAVEQLEYASFMQTYWSDNSVSVTVYYSEDELPDMREWLSKNYNDKIKSVSFLLRSGHGFKQAPLEAISEDVYDKMVRSTKPITGVDDKEVIGLDDSLECGSGFCPVK